MRISAPLLRAVPHLTTLIFQRVAKERANVPACNPARWCTEEHTGAAWPFTSATGSLSNAADHKIARFTQEDVEELHDQDDHDLPPRLTPLAPVMRGRVMTRMTVLMMVTLATKDCMSTCS